MNERLEEANELANQEPGTREQHDEYEEENEYADDPDYQAVQRENPFVNPLRKISVTDFHPSTIDQKMVIQFILENPEVAPCFDMTWFVFDKNMLFHLYSHDKALFYEWLGELKLMEAKWDRVELIKREYWIRLRQARVEEDLSSKTCCSGCATTGERTGRCSIWTTPAAAVDAARGKSAGDRSGGHVDASATIPQLRRGLPHLAYKSYVR